MSFFLRKKAVKGDKKVNKKRKVEDSSSKKLDDEISSDSDQEIDHIKKSKLNQPNEDDEIEETAQERKLRLAKKYLEEIERAEKERQESKPDVRVIDGEVVTERPPVPEKQCFEFLGPDLESIVCMKNAHRLSVTAVAVSSDDKFMISGSKEGRLIKYCLETYKKLNVINEGRKVADEEEFAGHTSCILSIAISSDSSRVASSDESKFIKVWDPNEMQLLQTLKGHRAPVTGLSFRINHHTLYSCSRDKTVKLWDIDELGYMETLFGHQSAVMCIDSMYKDRALTAGGMDSSIRIWKIVEESQLLFQANGPSIDCVKYLDEQHFISGADDGSITLWGLFRKKPLFTVPIAHGMGTSHPNWITSIATLRNSDLFASGNVRILSLPTHNYVIMPAGSQDGRVHVWKLAPDFRKFQLVSSIPVCGFVNSIAFSSNGLKLILGVGQEHRLGRWWKVKEGRNQVMVISLKRGERIDLPSNNDNS